MEIPIRLELIFCWVWNYFFGMKIIRCFQSMRDCFTGFPNLNKNTFFASVKWFIR